ncbi:NAD dependent epimerase/dehydratase [Gaeumannomyces tritici R3-111a-1]|uniref:NAD dependent epimerase/dehydratase n=1 Tax=Gaeumannomyces tritici (strain R3-111a-1) TaxID=644352 RepID=J3PKS8_GAET3|nr:NAD dependent epimerase/dehydratase [Gaeumannomyces tritici R3-111a-1]EJT68272.1 NAD dependent epimerase/dehydratase [Gaeumannomyces tritici R3-111a-1]
MAAKSVLILGGNGKISRLLTPMLLGKGWKVTSVIRDPDQQQAIRADAPASGTLDVLIRSLEAVRSEADARAIIQESNPDYVVWSAGAGGKGAPERTFAIDRDAAIHFIKASAATPSVKRFVMVSHLGSRRRKPAWWSDADWDACRHLAEAVLPRYYQAKLAADEVLHREGRTGRPDFVAVCLRPGTLTDGPAGPVDLGRTAAGTGKVSRASVAEVAAALLELDDERAAGVRNSWLDLLDGGEDVQGAVARVARERVDAAPGEPVFEEE